MDKKRLTLSQAAKYVGVHPKTLQRLDRECVLKAKRTSTNRRYYTLQDMKNFKENRKSHAKKVLIKEITQAVEKYNGRMES